MMAPSLGYLAFLRNKTCQRCGVSDMFYVIKMMKTKIMMMDVLCLHYTGCVDAELHWLCCFGAILVVLFRWFSHFVLAHNLDTYKCTRVDGHIHF